VRLMLRRHADSTCVVVPRSEALVDLLRVPQPVGHGHLCPAARHARAVRAAPGVEAPPCAAPPPPRLRNRETDTFNDKQSQIATQEQTRRVFPPVAVERRGGFGAAHHRQRRHSRPPRLRAPRRTLVRLRRRLHFKRAAQHARPPAAARRAVPYRCRTNSPSTPHEASRRLATPQGVAAGPLARSTRARRAAGRAARAPCLPVELVVRREVVEH